MDAHRKLRIEVDLNNLDDLEGELHRIIGWAKAELKFGVKETWIPLSNLNYDHIGNAFLDIVEETTLSKIQGALNTEETGDNLVSVARDAHEAEQKLAARERAPYPWCRHPEICTQGFCPRDPNCGE